MGKELKACRNCGGKCDPTGWMRGDGLQGPECEGCGITTPDVESWNRLMGEQATSQGGEAVAMRQRFSQIEDEIMAGKHTAASVFTQMRTAALYTHPADQVAEGEQAADGDRPGYDALWLWFSMSRSSYAVLPRVMMHDMPDAWQAAFARLMDEWDETWINQPDYGTRVQLTDLDGKLIGTPGWLLNYRHPDREQLDRMRAANAPSQGNKP